MLDRQKQKYLSHHYREFSQKNFFYTSRFAWLDFQTVIEISNKKDKIERDAREIGEKKKKLLATKIKEVDQTATDEADLRRKIYQETDRAVEESLDESLKKNVKVSLQDLRNDSLTKNQVETELQKGKKEAREEADKAIAEYLKAKAEAKRHFDEKFQQVPPIVPTSPGQQTSAQQTPQPGMPEQPTPVQQTPTQQTPEQQRTEQQPAKPAESQAQPSNTPAPAEIQAKRDEELRQIREKRDALRQSISAKPSAIDKVPTEAELKNSLSQLDQLTDPDSDHPHTIPDYDEGGSWFGIDENKVNPVRDLLTGDLIGIQIAKDRNAVDQEMKTAHDLYEKSSGEWLDTDFDRLFKRSHLENELGLKDFLVKAESYNPVSNKVKAAIASLLKISADYKEYENYLVAQLKDFNFSKSDTEEAQLLKLLTLKSLDKFNEAKVEESEALLQRTIHKALDQHEQFEFENEGLLSLLKGENVAYTKADRETKLRILAKADEVASAEIKDFIKAEAEELRTKLTDLTTELEQKNAGTLVIDKQKIEQLKNQTSEYVKQINNNLLTLNKQKSLLELVNGEALKTLESLNNDADLHLTLLNQYIVRAGDSKSNIPAVNPSSGMPAVGAFAPGENVEVVADDPYEKNWDNGIEVESKFILPPEQKIGASDSYLILAVESGDPNRNVRYRSDRGKKISYLENGAEVRLVDNNGKAKKVLDLTFVEVEFLYNGNKVWIAQEYLFPKRLADKSDFAADTKPPEADKPSEYVKPSALGFDSDEIFENIKSRIEATPLGITFDLYFNDKKLYCRAQKMTDGYHLFYQNQDVINGNLIFRSINEMQSFVRNGYFQQNLTENLLKNPNFYKFNALAKAINLDNLKQNQPYHIIADLNWKGVDINDYTGEDDAKLNLQILNGGVIKYKIRRDFVGPRGENFREGYAESIDQLLYKIAHFKQWAENYEDMIDDGKNLPAKLHHENLLSTISESSKYNERQALIGPIYEFTSYLPTGRATMRLSWDGTLRNSSTQNPTLIVTVSPRGTLNYWIDNYYATDGKKLALQAEAVDFNTLLYSISEIKRDPLKYLKAA